MKIIALGALIVLGGCAGAVPVAGGAIAGGISTFFAFNADADIVIKDVKPFNEGLCFLHPFNPKSPEAEAAIKAFCENLPDSTLGLPEQLFAVIEAVDAAAAQTKAQSK